MIKVNNKISVLFILVLTVLLATTIVSASDSNSTTDTSSVNSIDYNSASVSEISDINTANEEKTTSDTSSSTHEIKNTSNNGEKITQSTSTSKSSDINTNSNSVSQNINTEDSNSQTTSHLNKNSSFITDNTTYSTSKTSNSVSNTSNTTTINENNKQSDDYNITQEQIVDNKEHIKTSTNYNVYSFDQLASVISDIKSDTVDTSYTINLQKNSISSAYYITEVLSLSDSSTINKIVTINGNGVTIDGRNTYGFMNITSKYNVYINDLNIKNCNSNTGVFNNKGVLTITNSNITNNNGSTSGVIYNYQGDVSLINSRFENNYAKYTGVIDNFYASLYVSNSVFINNTSNNEAGVIFNQHSYNNIEKSQFINSTGLFGGVIYNFDYSSVYISNSLLSNNTAYVGGVLYNYDACRFVATNCNFTNNNASNHGLVIANTENSSCTIQDSLFENNIGKGANVIDGQDFDYTSNLKIYNTKFKNNNASDSLIYLSKNNFLIENCTFEDDFKTNYHMITYYTTNATITDSTFTNSYNETIIFATRSNSIITNNKFYSYNSSQNSLIVNRGNLTLSDNTIYVEENAFLNQNTVILSPIEDTSLTNEDIIKIKIDGTTYSAYIDEDSAVQKNYTFTTTGKHDVLFDYSTVYSDNSITVVYLVSIESSKIFLDNISRTAVGNTAYINGNLYDQNNTSLANKNLVLTINNVNYSISTNEYGNFKYNYTTTISGTNNVTVTFDGDNGKYQAVSTSTTFEVYANPTYIYMNSVSNKTINAVVSIVGRLTDLDTNLTNQNIILDINGEKITLKTNSSGNFTYNFTVTELGTNTVIASFEGNNEYASTTKTLTFNVSQSSTGVKIDSHSNAVIGGTINITGQLRDDKGNGLPYMNLIIYVNDDQFSYTTNSIGNFTLEYTTKQVGSNTVTVVFEGNDKFKSSQNVMRFQVIETASKIVVNPVTTKNGYKINLTAYITDTSGDPVKTGQATFKLNDNTIKVNGTQIKVNVTNGVAQYTFTVPNYSAKDYKLTAVYGGYEVRLEDSTTFVIEKSDPELKMTSVTSNGKTGKITGMLLDEHGVGVDRDTKVSVKINGKTVLNTRIYDGVIDLEFNTSAYKNGIHNLTVIFGENGCYNTVTYEGVISQNIKNTIIINPVTGKNGDVVSFRAYVIDKNGNSATSGSATFKLNSVTIKENGTQIKVNLTNGIAEYNFTIPDYSAKDYNLTAVASVGTTRYENTSVLKIEKTDTHVQLDPITINQGSNATVTGSILDERNNPITIDTKVSVKINSKTVENTRVYDGLIDVPIDTSNYSKGNYTIDFVAGENGRYNTSTGSTTLTIK